jgi:hypothetical protein
MTNKYIFADRVQELLAAHPEGLSTYEIYNRLADDRRNTRWLPSRNSIGSRMAAIGGFVKDGSTTGYSAMTSRRVVVWTLDLDKWRLWRGLDE